MGDSTARLQAPLARAFPWPPAPAAAHGGAEADGRAYLLHLFFDVLLLSFLHKDPVAPSVFLLASSNLLVDISRVVDPGSVPSWLLLHQTCHGVRTGTSLVPLAGMPAGAAATPSLVRASQRGFRRLAAPTVGSRAAVSGHGSAPPSSDSIRVEIQFWPSGRRNNTTADGNSFSSRAGRQLESAGGHLAGSQ